METKADKNGNNSLKRGTNKRNIHKKKPTPEESSGVVLFYNLYGGADLENAIGIMEVLSNGNFEQAAELFNGAGHSGFSAAMVMSVVENFRHDDFKEFQNAVEELERSERSQAD